MLVRKFIDVRTRVPVKADQSKEKSKEKAKKKSKKHHNSSEESESSSSESETEEETGPSLIGRNQTVVRWVLLPTKKEFSVCLGLC